MLIRQQASSLVYRKATLNMPASAATRSQLKRRTEESTTAPDPIIGTAVRLLRTAQDLLAPSANSDTSVSTADTLLSTIKDLLEGFSPKGCTSCDSQGPANKRARRSADNSESDEEEAVVQAQAGARAQEKALLKERTMPRTQQEAHVASHVAMGQALVHRRLHEAQQEQKASEDLIVGVPFIADTSAKLCRVRFWDGSSDTNRCFLVIALMDAPTRCALPAICRWTGKALRELRFIDGGLRISLDEYRVKGKQKVPQTFRDIFYAGIDSAQKPPPDQDDGTSLPTMDIEIVHVQYGGKGGFGSMLRAAGGKMSSNARKRNQGVAGGADEIDAENASCRDLSGRKLSVLRDARRLAAYLEQEPARRRAMDEKMKAKYAKLERMLGRTPRGREDLLEAAEKLGEDEAAMQEAEEFDEEDEEERDGEGREQRASGSGSGSTSKVGIGATGAAAAVPASGARGPGSAAGRVERFEDHEYLEQSREIVSNARSAVALGESRPVHWIC